MAYQIHAASAAAYNFLYHQQLLCLPSVCTSESLREDFRLTAGLNLEIETDLKFRTAQLNDFYCNVLLMIDEIYLSKWIEYSGDEVHDID